jgi:hypothetical protein
MLELRGWRAAGFRLDRRCGSKALRLGFDQLLQPFHIGGAASSPRIVSPATDVFFAIDFLAGGHLIGIAASMFDERLSLPLRSLSLFHALPATLLFLLSMFGYDKRRFRLSNSVSVGSFVDYLQCGGPKKNIKCGRVGSCDFLLKPKRAVMRLLPGLNQKHR